MNTLYRLNYKSSTEIILFQVADSIIYKVKTQNGISYLESVALDTQPIDYYGNVTYPTFLLYKPLHADTIQVFENTGISKYVRFIPCSYANIAYNKITFTYLTYGFFKNDVSSYYSGSDINNVFDKNYLNLMSIGDTIAIQQKQFIYVK